MAPPKSSINMPGVAPGKALAGVPISGNETAEERVLALLGGSVAEDTYQVSSDSLFCLQSTRAFLWPFSSPISP